jgi:hypothetical protein
MSADQSSNLAPPTHEDNDTFSEGTYNGISVIQRDKDRFINATAMCKQFGKIFRKIFENKAWKAYYKEFKTQKQPVQNSGGFIYVINADVTKDLKGSYVDPKLINYIAFWASPKYAVHVGMIMDKIHQTSQATGQTFEQTKDKLISDLQTTIDAQQTTIDSQKTTIDTHITLLNTSLNEITQTSTRTPDNSRKLFTIFVHLTGFKVSADSSHPRTSYLKQFVFPATMNIKQELKKAIGLYTFTDFEQYNNILTIIRGFAPKEEIIGNQRVPTE